MVNQRYYRGVESTVLLHKNIILSQNYLKSKILNQRSRASQYAVNRWAAIEVDCRLCYHFVFL